MKRIGKYFLMIVMLICMFSYMGVVNAATIKALDTNKSSVKVLLTGKELSDSDKEKIESLLSTYSMYYKYEPIENDVYSSYKANDSTAASTINGLISDPTSSDDFTTENGWTQITTAKITYEDLSYDPDTPAGYVVCLYAYSGTDTSTLYYYKSVYQSVSSSELALYSDIANQTGSGDVVKKNNAEDSDAENPDSEDGDENENVDKDEDTEEKADTNPETGISDVAMIIVPASLIAGTALMIKRRYV